MIVSNKVVFIHIPKTAGRSIYLKLCEVLNVEYDKRGVSVGYNDMPIHSKASEVRRLIGDNYDTAYKFSIVRNPLDRLVSFYFYGNINFKYKFFSFEEFIEYVCSDNLEASKDWSTAKLTQCSYLDDEIDSIGRLEDIDDYWLHIRKELKAQELPKVNYTHHQHYTHYYSPKLEKMVLETFKEDVERFYPELL